MSTREHGAVVGPALRAAITRVNEADPRLGAGELRVFMAVIARTASWSRLEDSVTHAVLAEIAGVDRETLRRALRRLSELGAIEYLPGAGKRYSSIALPPATTQGGESAGGRSDSVGVAVRVPPAPTQEGVPCAHTGDKRNGITERTNGTDSDVASATHEPADALTRAAADRVEEHDQDLVWRSSGVCSECGVSVAVGRHAADCPALQAAATEAST